MESSLCWKSEDEGILQIMQGDITVCFSVYLIGEEEAELSLQDIVFTNPKVKNEFTQEIIAFKVTESLKEAFRLLWDEELEAISVVGKKGSEFGEILDSTTVVQKLYSEYMLKKVLRPGEYTMDGSFSGEKALILTMREEGLIGENSTGTFFCHLQNYQDGYYLYEVEVNKDSRNQGIATACLQQLFEVLSADGETALYLQVGSYNVPAIHLYNKLGFIAAEELCYYVPTEAEEE